MKILIDGDACPVKAIVYEVAANHNVKVVVIMSIKHHSLNNKDDTIYVDSTSQAADIAIVNRALKGDIVVTGDYGLASLCLSKGCYCISFSGRHMTNNNIDELLSIRFINQKVRASGERIKGPPKRTSEDDDRFRSSLEKIILSQYSNPQLEL